ncbi:MAG: UDP-glucose 4-epimerase GalE [Simkaniaceae bacterium]|nr:UDP-glucose 4-epimerase GalE [Simkaniaceae bacterium]
MQTVFVTGGAGYIGSHVCKKLKEQGYLPIAYDNLSSGKESFVKWGPFVKGDIGDKHAASTAFTTYKPIAVIHLAAFTNMRESLERPTSYYENNVGKTITLLDCMLEHKIPHCIFSSSCSVYGTPQKLPLAETHRLDPQTPYCSSKYLVEHILQNLSKKRPLNYASLRYFNAAGSDHSNAIGENHSPETHIIPLVIQAAINNKKALPIFGSDHATPDGTTVRDFIHVTDLAAAHVKALKYLVKNKENIELNLGSGKGVSILDIIHAVEKISKKKFPYHFEQKYQYDPPILIADYQKAKKLLNWEPKNSDLETIIKTAYHYQLKLLTIDE